MLWNKIREKLQHSLLLELREISYRLDELLTYKAEGALCFTNQRYYEMGNGASQLLAFQVERPKQIG